MSLTPEREAEIREQVTLELPFASPVIDASAKMLRDLLSEIDRLRAELEVVHDVDRRIGHIIQERDTLRAENERLREAIAWALGENGDFRVREDGEGRYWWRTELRARASGAGGAQPSASDATLRSADPAPDTLAGVLVSDLYRPVKRP